VPVPGVNGKGRIFHYPMQDLSGKEHNSGK